MSGKQGIERRKAPRIVVTLRVSVEMKGSTVWGKSRDLSERGIFVSMPIPVPADEMVDLMIESGGKEEPILVRGRVVHALPVGNGIEFVSPSFKAKEGISALLLALKKAAGGPRSAK